jgi:hypothetical protein
MLKLDIPVTNVNMASPPEGQRLRTSPCLPNFGDSHRKAMAMDPVQQGTSDDEVVSMTSLAIDVAVRPMDRSVGVRPKFFLSGGGRDTAESARVND